MCKYLKITPILILLFFLGTAHAEETLTWEGCIKEAAKNHPDLISAQESVKQSEAAKKISASALFPQAEADANISRTKTSTVSSGKTTSTTKDSYGYEATGTQLLFDGFKVSSDIKAATENIKAAEYNYKFISSEVRARLRAAFINLLKAQELLNITEDIYKIRRGNLELITLRYESGMEHRGALMTAQANLSQAGFEIMQNKRALEVAQRELVKEMGRAQFSPMRVDGMFKVSDAALEKPDFEALAKNNPSLGNIIAQKNAAMYGIKSAVANYFPSISAQAGAGKSDSTWPPVSSEWDAGLKLSFPLLEGGLRSAEVAQAEAVFNQAKANERSIQDGLVLALEQDWAALQDAVETVDVQKKFLDATTERSNIAEAQYSLGLMQYDNWTIIEDDLVKSKKSFLDAQANALLAEANWIQAKGETLEYAQ